MSDDFYHLDKENTDPKRIKVEREKARELRASAWWKEKIQNAVCHYCEKKVSPQELTMDHLVPLARGGLSVKNNLVPACKECNAKKKLHTPVDLLFQQLEAEKSKNKP
jgi:5-methylcytosine-specific restriction protein A